MALRSFRECKCVGCHNLTRDTYCDEHIHMKIEDEKKRQIYYDKYKRNKKTRTHYLSKEHKLWATVVRSNAKGLCQICSTSSDPIIGTEADHIIPIDTVEGWERRLDPTNGQLLCHACHMKKTTDDLKKYVGKRIVGRGDR